MATVIGTSGGNVLNGTGVNDEINGLAGNDTLYGGGGLDILTGGSGNDTIDGGTGTDIAVFSGNRANYATASVNGVTTVKALSGTDGTDTLTNVEYLSFADQTIRIPPSGMPDTLASTPTLTVTAASGSEDKAIALGSHITAALTDTDGSEVLAIKIAGVPTGATLSAGANKGGGIWTLTPAQIAGLTITPPRNADAAMSLTVTATSTESNGGATASKSAMLAVQVTGVADAPTLTVSDTHGTKNTAIALGSHITTALTDTDGSETLAIKIAGVPTGATLSGGTNNGGGNWTLTPAQLTNLKITPPSNSTTPITLTVSAVSTEDNGTTATTTKTLKVTIDPTVLTVGAGGQFASLAAAIAASHDGDTIQVQAGTYTNDFATINTKINLVGVGGMVHLVATGNIPNGKAILITNADVTITNFEFSGARVVDSNGAGIRYQAGNLTLNKCYFHDNQNGLLAADNLAGSIVINDSEFAHNGVGDPSSVWYGHTHNLYVLHIAKLTITGSYFHDAVAGHEIKSLARTTTIRNSRIFDGTGTASYSIDLPSGGAGTIQNNTIQQGPNSLNSIIIQYGEEAVPFWATNSLLVDGNVILDDLTRGGTVAVHNSRPSVTAQITNNHFWGIGAGDVIASGTNSQSGNTTLASEPALDLSHPWSATQGPVNPTVTATATETDGNTAPTSVVLPVSIGASTDTTASMPALTVTPASGSEGTAIALGSYITALTDTATGDNYLRGNAGAGTFVFAEAASGHDKIADFTVGTGGGAASVLAGVLRPGLATQSSDVVIDPMVQAIAGTQLDGKSSGGLSDVQTSWSMPTDQHQHLIVAGSLLS